jgi:hypothetical protein
VRAHFQRNPFWWDTPGSWFGVHRVWDGVFVVWAGPVAVAFTVASSASKLNGMPENTAKYRDSEQIGDSTKP